MKALFLLALLILQAIGMAATPSSMANTHLAPGISGFEENKGQVRNTDGSAAPFVRYRLSQNNTQIFLLQNGIAYQFSRLHHMEDPHVTADGNPATGGGVRRSGMVDPAKFQLETYRMDMILEGADANARVSTEGRSEDYTNYYNHDALDVRSHSKVTYHDIYPGIDWVVYTTVKGMKYDFVVRPGADPDRIRMRFEHHEELRIDNDGSLIHGNRLGRFTEQKPVSFQNGTEILTRFVLEGNTLKFALEDHDRAQTLVIDPARLWGTYYGEAGEEAGWSCTTDANGNVYLSGSSSSSAAIASGGHQTTLGGTRDAYLVKFNALGTRLWATYYGGEGDEVGFQCALDANGNVFMAGYTSSTTAIASAGHQGTFGGDLDAYLVKFNASGTRLWATYYGDMGYDRGLHCITDANGNVYMSGETSSSSAMASGGHQNTYGGGSKDAFLVKFSGTGTRLWGTYYGGNDFEDGASCDVDASGNVFLSGQTGSSTSIASGGHQNVYGGSGDAFLAKFNSNGTRLWGTYYGGTGGEHGWQCAVSGDAVFLAGATSSASGIASGGHQNAFGGGPSDAFIAKFNTNGTRIWASYYGGSNEDFAYSCSVDAAGSAYLAGFTNSSSGIALNGHQNSFGGGDSDAFLAKFDRNGGRVWGTYYGGTGFEGGFWEANWFVTGRCTVDPSGNAYLAGITTSNTNISASGHQNVFGGGHDAVLVKFEDRSITTGVIIGPICTAQAVSIPFTVSGAFNPGNVFTAQLSDASGSFAGPISIGSLNGTTSGTINGSLPVGTTPGSSYRIRVVGSNPIVIGSDNGTDLLINDPTTSCVCATTPEVEQNNTVGTANVLVYDTPKSGIIGQCSVLDNSSDHFSFITTTQGVLTVEFCMSNTGSEEVQVPIRLLNSTGTTLATSTHIAGANDQEHTSPFYFICIGIGTYQIVIDHPGDAGCTNYTLSYSLEEPVFGNDPEPNDAIGASATPVAHDTYQDGRISFNGETPYDYYSILPPTNGVMNIEVQAEQVNSVGEDLIVTLLDQTGTVLQTWNLPVGDFSAVSTNTASITCRSTMGPYYLRFNTDDCGASYRFKYWMTPPLFAADSEPNDIAPGTSVAYDTYIEGQIQFHGESPYDYYNIIPPINGVMTIEVQAEHVGNDPAAMDVVLFNTVGGIMQTWSMNVGANGSPATTTVSIPCLGNTTDYDLRFSTTTCGVSYMWKYTMTPPLFANDTEPNNSLNGSIESYDTWHDGQIGFDEQASDDDIFTIDPPSDGVMNIEVEAEHTGAVPGTVTVALVSVGGSVISTWDIEVGANGIAADTLVNVICRNGDLNYNLRFSDVTCGVSYRWKYTMTAPHFANDIEPNNTAPGIPLDHDTYTEGHVQFDGETMDHFSITPPTNGVMNFEVEAEHVGVTTGTMELRLLSNGGSTIQIWNIPVGANGIPEATAISIPCRSTLNPYTVRISATTCGVSYRFKYFMTAPLFANDAEPNNAQPGTPLAADTYTEGQIGFDAESTYDIYRIQQNTNGRVNVELQAEHTGATPGTMTVTLLTTMGSTVHTWSFPIGANSIPISTILSRTCLVGPTTYDLRLSSSVCGASYKLKYTITPAAFNNDVEPNNAVSQAIILPETQTSDGQLNFPGQDNTDHYQLALSGNGILNLHFEAEHAGVETNANLTVELYWSAGPVLQSWTVPIGADAVPISTTLNSLCRGNSSLYYLRVSSNICGTSYRFSYSVTPPVFAQDTESNNSVSQAIVLPETQTADGHLNFSFGDNTDHYRADLSNDGVINVTLEAEHAGSEINGVVTLELYVSSGVVLQTWIVPVGANSNPLSTTVSRSCLGNTLPYYLRVSSSICGTSYRISYTVTPPLFANDVEPNNGVPGTPVAHDTYADGHLGFYNLSAYDYFNIIPPVNGVMRFEVQAEHAGAAVDSMEIRLITSAGTTIQFWTIPVGANGIPITTMVTIPCRGSSTDYDVRFLSHACGTSYRWKYTMLPAYFPTDIEPNNGTPGSGGSPVAHDTYQDGQIGFDAQTGNDLYNIVAPVNGVMNFEVQAEHAGPTEGSMTFTLYTSAGTVIQSWTVSAGANGVPITSNFSITCRGNTTDYDVAVNGVTCGVSYRWKYTMTPPLFTNDVEPNGSVSTAIILPPSTETTGQLNFNAGENNDYYRINVPEDGTLHVTIEAEHSGASLSENITARILLSSGSTLATWNASIGANSTPASTSYNFNCSATGVNYYLQLISGVCGTSYKVSWTVTPAVYTNDVEPNNSSGAATAIDLNNSPQTGHIGFQTDDDWYIFSHPGGPWSATVSAEHAGVGEGSFGMAVRFLFGTAVATFSVPAGGLSTPVTNTFTIANLNAGSYRISLSDVTCGVSYKIHCYDDDGDGVCNGSDVCAGGPEPGMPCDDGDPLTPFSVIDSNCACVASEQFVTVNASVLLDGAYNTSTLMMNDDLRNLNIIPLSHPYGNAPFNHGGSESIDASVLALTGDDAIVDWVLLELRDKTAPATMIARRAALVQRDGHVVDLDGNSAVKFFNTPDDAYYLVVRHRNHLGVMTGQTHAFSQASTAIDLTDPLMLTYGSNAQRARGSVMTLWSGNANANSLVSYSGSSNDRTSILNLLGASTFLSPQNGYFTQDVNMNGMVSYSGSNNDRTNVLNSLGASTFLTPLVEQLP